MENADRRALASAEFFDHPAFRLGWRHHMAGAPWPRAAEFAAAEIASIYERGRFVAAEARRQAGRRLVLPVALAAHDVEALETFYLLSEMPAGAVAA